MIKLHIGFDDIDSPFGGCTTHFTAQLLVKWIRERNIKLFDYPNLIRLNPAVPWKTRGNGSLVLRILVDDFEEARDLFEEAVVEAYEYVGKYSHPESQPAVIAYIGELTPRIKWFGEKALTDLIPLTLLERILEKHRERILYREVKGKRGLIGGLAGIGYRMIDRDYTYELIAYRSNEYIGKPRQVDPSSVKVMDEKTKPYTFLNYDPRTGKPLITPHGPDPVLLGIRGEDPEVLVKAYNYLRINEPVPLRMIYRTNQHTDAHLRRRKIREAYIYTGAIIRGIVYSKPKRIRGGHIVFRIRDETGVIDAAAYEPTKDFRRIVEKLAIGDIVEVYGVVRPQSSRHGPTLNIEKIRVVAVKPLIVLENPICPRCGVRMKSMGRGKGYKCPKCGYRDPKARKIIRYLDRDLEPGLYEPPPSAFKHLMKPILRIGREKKYFPEIYTPRNYIWVDNNLLQ